MTLTADQIESLKRGEPVRLSAPEVGGGIAVIREAEFAKLQEILDDEKAAWAKLGEEAAAQWAKENSY